MSAKPGVEWVCFAKFFPASCHDVQSMLAYTGNDRRPTDPDDVSTCKVPLWEVVYPDQEAASTLAWERVFFDAKVQGDTGSPDDSIGKPSKRKVVVTTREDVPPLERKVGQYPGYISFAPL